MTMNEIRAWKQVLLRSSHQEKVRMFPFFSKRADVIAAVVVALFAVMEYFDYEQIVVSEGRILLGVLKEFSDC